MVSAPPKMVHLALEHCPCNGGLEVHLGSLLFELVILDWIRFEAVCPLCSLHRIAERHRHLQPSFELLLQHEVVTVKADLRDAMVLEGLVDHLIFPQNVLSALELSAFDGR